MGIKIGDHFDHGIEVVAIEKGCIQKIQNNNARTHGNGAFVHVSCPSV
jgi:hypothetical protein